MFLFNITLARNVTVTEDAYKFETIYKFETTRIKPILVSIKFGHCSFEAAVSEWLMLWTRTNSIRVRSPSR